MMAMVYGLVKFFFFFFSNLLTFFFVFVVASFSPSYIDGVRRG